MFTGEGLLEVILRVDEPVIREESHQRMFQRMARHWVALHSALFGFLKVELDLPR